MGVVAVLVAYVSKNRRTNVEANDNHKRFCCYGCDGDVCVWVVNSLSGDSS